MNKEDFIEEIKKMTVVELADLVKASIKRSWRSKNKSYKSS